MQEVKAFLKSRAVVAILSALASVAGTQMATEWPAVWRAMCLS